ncbi:hypothetical protein SVIOM342S_05440 [Streptomyces violaceorubidus]
MVRPSFSSIVEVKIGRGQLPDTIAPMLTDGWVDQGVNVPAALRLTFRDPYHRLLGKLNVQFGTKVVITPIADGHGKGNPLLTGEVTGLETDYDGTGSFTVIRGYDYGHRLMRQRRVAAYRNQKASDIARKLVAMDGVSIGRIQATKGALRVHLPVQRHRLGLPRPARRREQDDHVSGLQGEVPVRHAEAVGRRTPRRTRTATRAPSSSRPATTSCGCGPPSPPPTRSARSSRAAGTSPPRRRSPRPRRPPPTRASASSGRPARPPASSSRQTRRDRQPVRQAGRGAERPRRPSPPTSPPPSPSWRSPPTATPTCGPASPSRSPTSAPPSRASTPSPRYATTSATASPTSPGSRSADASGVPCTASPRAAAAARTRRAPPGCPASPTPSSPTYRTPSSRAGSSCSSVELTSTSATGRAASRWAAWRAAASSPWTSATRCWSPSTRGRWTTRS